MCKSFKRDFDELESIHDGEDGCVVSWRVFDEVLFCSPLMLVHVSIFWKDVSLVFSLLVTFSCRILRVLFFGEGVCFGSKLFC